VSTAQIEQLLQPGRRQRGEASARIRTLLAMEAHVAEGVAVSEKDIKRIERAIRTGKAWPEVFPRLASLVSQYEGEGPTLRVHISRNEGAPVRIISADDPDEAAAVREVDLQRKYRYSPTELAQHLDLTPPRAKALRHHLNIDTDKQCAHTFEFGSQKLPRYSDRAVEIMRKAKAEVDMDTVWQSYRAHVQGRNAE
jgi:hypothetical protein